MFFSFLKSKPKVIIRKRQEHCISRKNISREALRVLYRLNDAGYKAYLVGGGVRDLLLGRTPKDFDVGTDARPREIKNLFHRSFIIGKRFRIVHVVFGDTIIETTTFRAKPQPQPQEETVEGDTLYQTSDNNFGTPEEDAQRRDFTVNGLFYDINTFNVIDYVGGLKDLKKKSLRSIGDPNIRFEEDPVRMMRAIRLSTKLGFTIEVRTYKAILDHAQAIANASTARVVEEIFRLFYPGCVEQNFHLLWQTGLMKHLLPFLYEFIEHNGQENCAVWDCLKAFDKLTKGGRELRNSVNIAALYMAPFLAKVSMPHLTSLRESTLYSAGEHVLATASNRYQLPKCITKDAIYLLVKLAHFERSPKRNLLVRSRHKENFLDALLIAKIRDLATSQNNKYIKQWENVQFEQ